MMSWLGGAELHGQGTRQDYDRAAGLKDATRNKVFRTLVKPRWSAQGDRLWYRIDLPDDSHEFVVVNTVDGIRKPAFDSARLATALGQFMGKDYAPGRLPIQSLHFPADHRFLHLRVDGRVLQLALDTYTLTDPPSGTEPNVADGRLSKLAQPKRSRIGGEESEVVFVNELGEAVELWWVPPAGEWRFYRQLSPGETHVQHTYDGHVWVARLDDGEVAGIFEAVDFSSEAVIDRHPPNSGLDPKPSVKKTPTSRWQAIIDDHNIHLQDKETGQSWPLTTDGTTDDPYTSQFHWSPDRRYFVAIKTQIAQDHTVHFIESSPAEQLQPRLHSFNYLKPGDRIARSRLFVVNPAEREVAAVAEDLYPNPWAVDGIRWRRDSTAFTFRYNQRGHQHLRVISVGASTAQPRVIVEEAGPTFIDYNGKFFLHYLDASEELIWMSERSGWNHLYLYDAQSASANAITQGSWVVRGVDRVDADKRQIWFRAGGIHPHQDPYYVHYARINFDGSGLVVLTEGNGTHKLAWSPDRKHYVDTWSRVDQPPIAELRRAQTGALICKLEEADHSQLLETGWQPPQPFKAKGRDGHTDIFGVIIRPTRFDPTRQYPVIEKIYAGPHSAFVRKSWRDHDAMQRLAELGFIVVQIDGMGTSHRSKAFHDVCWKNLRDAGFPDRIQWMKAAATKYPYIDITRVGIYGGSAGGQNTLAGMLWHPDYYKVGVADCGCHDNRMDKIWWNELWMGWPIDEAYDDNSNVTHAHRLQGKLLLTVGEMDRNVDPASTLQVVSALIKADKDFDFLIVPGAGHGVGDSSEYMRRRRADFFVRHLLGVEPRR
jgi:dipeptidyl aminopeptidase/acylaminoacyl peptidase